MLRLGLKNRREITVIWKTTDPGQAKHRIAFIYRLIHSPTSTSISSSMQIIKPVGKEANHRSTKQSN